MKRMKVIFVNMQATWHIPITKTILALSKSDKDFAVHMAIWFSEVNDGNGREMNEVIFEAKAPTSGFIDGTTYDEEPTKYVFEFEVPDEVYESGVKEALADENILYGLFTDCIATVIKDNTGSIVTDKLNCERTAICSELGMRILHAMFPDFGLDGDGNELDYNTISPCEAYHLFEEYAPTNSDINMISQG